MKTPNLDLEDLQLIDPQKTLQYLKSNKWLEIESKSTEEYLILKHSIQDKKEAYILLPLDSTIPDYASRIYDLIKVISIVENRSQSDVLNSIKSAKELAEEIDRDILNFKLKFKDSTQREVLAAQLGELLISFQNLIVGITCSQMGVPNIAGRIPNSIIEKSRVSVIGTFEGSFGLRIAPTPSSTGQLDILQKTVMRQAFEELFYLVKVSKDDKNFLKQKLVKLGKRSTSSYRNFLVALYKMKTDNTLEWGSSDKILGDSLEFTYQAVAKALAIVSDEVSEKPIEFEIYGRWIGGNKRQKNFEIKDDQNEKTYKGVVDSKALEDIKLANIDKSYNVTISEELILNEVTQEVTTKHVLLKLEELSNN
jgi:hypothetical protein